MPTLEQVQRKVETLKSMLDPDKAPESLTAEVCSDLGMLSLLVSAVINDYNRTGKTKKDLKHTYIELEEIESKANKILKNHGDFSLSCYTAAKEEYDYYIEPCQRCINSDGGTYEKCGWCHDSDTFYTKRDRYLGNYIKLPYKGCGYPYHEIPHPTRRYYKNNEYIEGSEGAIPSDVTYGDIMGAHARNEAVSGLLGLFKSGVRPTLSVNKKHVDEFLKNMSEIAQRSVSSDPPLLDVTGKTEFRFLTYTILSLSMDIIADTNKIEDSINNSEQQLAALINQSEYRKLCEVIAHEAFHILQAITTNSIGVRFDAQRRLSVLKWMLIEDFFLDRNGTVPFDTDAYNLLHYLDEQSGIYHHISRNFDYCRSDAKLILNYSHNSNLFDLNMFDLIEGNAFVFQKYILNNWVTIKDIVSESKMSAVYLNALNHYANSGGKDPIEFTLFCFSALKIGLIVDEDDFIDKPFNPVSLFGYICSLKKEQPNFLECDDFERVINLFEVRPLLERMGYSVNNAFIKYLDDKHIDDIRLFLTNALKYRKIHAEIFKFLKHVGLSESEYKNLKDLIESQQEIRLGQANERLKAVMTSVANELSIADNDLIMPFLLSFSYNALQILIQINNLTNNAKYVGAFGEEITTNSENTIINMIERLSDCMNYCKPIFCCDKHGFVSYKKILTCEDPNGLNNVLNSRFSRKLQEMIGSVNITFKEI